jgi:26S proteasome regulatory subunit N7
MALGQRIHRLADPASLLTEIGEKVENPSLYRLVLTKLSERDLAIPSVVLTEEQLQAMEKSHESKVAELEKAVEDAGENAGDMEVLDARIAVARFSAQSLDPATALSAYQKVMNLSKLSTGKKMDSLMESARIAFFYQLQGADQSAEFFITEAEKMSEKGGGDWDRRNRLKVYRALARLLRRDIEGAAPLLLEGMATFSCNELCSYADFLVYGMLSNLLHLKRPVLHEKILEGPEILAVQLEVPNVVSGATFAAMFYAIDRLGPTND